jgi:hypothetical protein
MGFRFRRTFKIIPGVRLNLSGGGASVSLGPRGLRYTIGSRGTRTTIGLPGSGLSWTAYKPYGSDSSKTPNGAAGYDANVDPAEPMMTDQSATVIDSAPIDQLVANSTIDIAGTLNAGRSRWRTYKIWITILSALCVIGAFKGFHYVPQAAALFIAAGVAIILVAILLHGREASTISLDYDLSENELAPFNDLTRAFDALAECSQIWSIPSETQQADWKRNAGAGKTIERKQIALRRGSLPLVASNVEFLQLPLGKETLYLTPDAILVMSGDAIAAFNYADVQVHCRQTKFIEDGTPPSDAIVVGETWQYLNRRGGPDRRFKNNRQLPICLYGEIDFESASGLNERIHCSRVDPSEQFASSAAAMPKALAGASMMPLRMISSDQNQDNEIADDVGAAYANETDLARSLALNHGKFWEFLLVEELLRSRLEVLKRDCEDLASVVPKKLITGREFVSWIGDEIAELSPVITNMAACIENDLMAALGKRGVAGDAIKLLSAVNAIFSNCRKFLLFETALNAADVSSAFYDLKDSFRGITTGIVRMVDDLTDQWGQNIERLRSGGHNFEVKISFKVPPQVERAVEEIEKIRKRPELL